MSFRPLTLSLFLQTSFAGADSILTEASHLQNFWDRSPSCRLKLIQILRKQIEIENPELVLPFFKKLVRPYKYKWRNGERLNRRKVQLFRPGTFGNLGMLNTGIFKYKDAFGHERVLKGLGINEDVIRKFRSSLKGEPSKKFWIVAKLIFDELVGLSLGEIHGAPKMTAFGILEREYPHGFYFLEISGNEKALRGPSEKRQKSLRLPRKRKESGERKSTRPSQKLT